MPSRQTLMAESETTGLADRVARLQFVESTGETIGLGIGFVSSGSWGLRRSSSCVGRCSSPPRWPRPPGTATGPDHREKAGRIERFASTLVSASVLVANAHTYARYTTPGSIRRIFRPTLGLFMVGVFWSSPWALPPCPRPSPSTSSDTTSPRALPFLLRQRSWERLGVPHGRRIRREGEAEPASGRGAEDAHAIRPPLGGRSGRIHGRLRRARHNGRRLGALRRRKHVHVLGASQVRAGRALRRLLQASGRRPGVSWEEPSR